MRWIALITGLALSTGCRYAPTLSARDAGTPARAVAARTADPVPTEAATEPAIDPGPLKALLARANEAHKPVVIQLSTEWCQACKMFEAQVLPDAKVREQLKDVVFATYDAQRGDGAMLAEKLGVRGFPTFVAIDARGDAKTLRVGIDPGVGWFLELLQASSFSVLSEEEILAKEKASPSDARVAYLTGRWFVDRGRSPAAIAHLEAAERLDKGDKLGVGARAAWDALVARRSADDRARATSELLKYVERHPSGRPALVAITIATVGAEMAAKERGRVWSLVVEANKADAGILNELVYDALAAGEIDGAVAAGKYLVLAEESANAHDTLAEAYNARGARVEALREEDAALKKTPEGDPERPGLDSNRTRFADRPGAAPPSSAATRSQVAELWKRRSSLDYGTIEDAASESEAFRLDLFKQDTAFILGIAGRDCAPSRGDLKEVYIKLEWSARAGAPKAKILEPEASAALRSCLTEKLSKARYTERPDAAPTDDVVRVALVAPGS